MSSVSLNIINSILEIANMKNNLLSVVFLLTVFSSSCEDNLDFEVKEPFKVGKVLSIECRLFNNKTEDIAEVEEITLFRKNTESQRYVMISQISPRGRKSELSRISFIDGQIGTPKEAFLHIRFEMTDCTDVTYYRCEIQGNNASGQFSNKRRTLSVTSVSDNTITDLRASPSNVNGGDTSLNNNATIGGDGEYTIGTAIFLSCYITGGVTAVPARLCHKLTKDVDYQPFAENLNMLMFPGNTPETRCIVHYVSISQYIVRMSDENGHEFFCESANTGNAVCSRPHERATFNLSAVQAIQCPSTIQPNTTTEGMSIQELSLAQTGNETAIPLIIVGIILIGLAIPAILIAVFSIIRIRKLRKDMAKMMTRETYDALNLQPRPQDGLTYDIIQTEQNGKQNLPRQDSAGYETPNDTYTTPLDA